jgi:hypothetical protein
MATVPIEGIVASAMTGHAFAEPNGVIAPRS